MANWAVDPLPHVPAGFTLEDPVLCPPLRHEVCVTGCYTLYNEDLAIIKLQPLVHKEDFEHLKTALRTFFYDVHQVRTTEIQPCAIGDAYVRFSSSLERERFLGPVFKFGNYAMSIIKHDEAKNALSLIWIVLPGCY